MKMKEAMALIKKSEKEKSEKEKKKAKELQGFMVHFEKKEGHILASGYFPDKHAGEKLIKTEDEAWELASRFAKATSPNEYVNIYVVDNQWRPVGHYTTKGIRTPNL
jgi:hypothetical protein